MIHVHIDNYVNQANTLIFVFFTVARVGFQEDMYEVYEGDNDTITVCVEIQDGNLTDLVYLRYMVQIHPDTASGEFSNEHYVGR